MAKKETAATQPAADIDNVFATEPQNVQPEINSPYGIAMKNAGVMIEFWRPEAGDVVAGHYLGRSQRKIGRNCPHVLLDFATGELMYLPDWHGLKQLDELQDIGCDFVEVTFKGERKKEGDETVKIVKLRIGKMPESKRLKVGVDFNPADWNTEPENN